MFTGYKKAKNQERPRPVWRVGYISKPSTVFTLQGDLIMNTFVNWYTLPSVMQEGYEEPILYYNESGTELEKK